MKQTKGTLGLTGVLAAGLLASVPSTTRAQIAPAKVFFACYVPKTGTVYRIKEPGLDPRCTGKTHVEFSWTDGVLTRDEPNGFAVTGTVGSGTIPTTGAGTRLMWYPGKAAFRVGRTDLIGWDDGQIGLFSNALGDDVRAPALASTAMGGEGTSAHGAYSTAMGEDTHTSGRASTAMGSNVFARGDGSTAMGASAEANGPGSTAMGNSTVAIGLGSTAMGNNTVASGANSTATGFLTTASGEQSTAMGSAASTNAQQGSFVYGDASVVCCSEVVDAIAPNSFVVRAQRVWLGKSGDQVATAGHYIETSTGAYLSDGGDWSNASDANRKENFREEDAGAVLARVSRLPIQSWNYKADDPSVRHLGPTAQDFHAAFQIGDGDKSISTVDGAGVALLAIQALEGRTREQAREVETLRAELAALRAEMAQRKP